MVEIWVGMCVRACVRACVLLSANYCEPQFDFFVMFRK